MQQFLIGKLKMHLLIAITNLLIYEQQFVGNLYSYTIMFFDETTPQGDTYKVFSLIVEGENVQGINTKILGYLVANREEYEY